ncbi:MAG: putative sulfate exporter family transporter [Peredibacter sp.]|nr:putative sulfate exporter family transporter [Peredibacter sp.]|tara:strand:+ start:5166 stop:6059 length:894 start_codon:yes stop_codon:yes gene_type:complete
MSFLSPQYTLLAGIVLALLLPYNKSRESKARLWSSKLLQVSVILLGASLNFNSVLKQGANGAGLTFISIIFVFVLGLLGVKWLKMNKDQGTLITMGTAICGGSAIGALAPVIAADGLAIAVSMGVVFLLNAVAVFIFPFFGEMLALSQEQFGLWSALAIHDTSSVVAASSIYGSKALEVATTVKLTRALWIVPVTLFFSVYSRKDGSTKVKLPWFIFGFLALSLIFTFFDLPLELQETLKKISKAGFAITLFLIGLTFSMNKIRQVGARPLIFGVVLWILVSFASLFLVQYANVFQS